MTGKPASAPFESNTFPVQVIVVYGSEGGWHVNTVLCRDGDGPVTPVAPWTQPWWPDDPDGTRSWDYLAERIRDGSGGNGISYEIQAYEVADPPTSPRLSTPMRPRSSSSKTAHSATPPARSSRVRPMPTPR